MPKVDFWKWIGGVVAAAVVAYFTTIQAISVGMMEVKTTEKLHHEATNARIDALAKGTNEKIDSVASDVRQIRDAVYVVAARAQRIEKEVR